MTWNYAAVLIEKDTWALKEIYPDVCKNSIAYCDAEPLGATIEELIDDLQYMIDCCKGQPRYRLDKDKKLVEIEG